MGARPNRLPFVAELPSDEPLTFGNTRDWKILAETIDPNAEALLFVAPEGGAVKVPVYIFGDSTAYNKDLGLFNGITDPTIAVLSDDATKAIYFYHDGSGGILKTTSGRITLSPVGNEVRLGDDVQSAWGGSSDFLAVWETADADAHYMSFVIKGSNNLIYNADSGTDWGHADSTNPTLWIQSADATSTNDYLKLYHDQTDGNFEAGAGDLKLQAAGNIRFGTHTGIGAESVTGYITVKDYAGNLRKLAVVS